MSLTRPNHAYMQQKSLDIITRAKIELDKQKRHLDYIHQWRILWWFWKVWEPRFGTTEPTHKKHLRLESVLWLSPKSRSQYWVLFQFKENNWVIKAWKNFDWVHARWCPTWLIFKRKRESHWCDPKRVTLHNSVEEINLFVEENIHFTKEFGKGRCYLLTKEKLAPTTGKKQNPSYFGHNNDLTKFGKILG